MKKRMISTVLLAAASMVAIGCNGYEKNITNVTNAHEQNATDANGYEYVSQGRMSATFGLDADGGKMLSCVLFFKADEKVDNTALIAYKIVNDELTLPTQKIIGTAGALSKVSFEYTIFERDAGKFLACGAEYYQENGTAVQVRSRGKRVSDADGGTTDDVNATDGNVTE